jgi:hypothetical protein
MYPGQTPAFRGNLTSDISQEVMAGTVPLGIITKASYQGPDGQDHSDTQKARYGAASGTTG